MDLDKDTDLTGMWVGIGIAIFLAVAFAAYMIYRLRKTSTQVDDAVIELQGNNYNSVDQTQVSRNNVSLDEAVDIYAAADPDAGKRLQKSSTLKPQRLGPTNGIESDVTGYTGSPNNRSLGR